ncbi:MAG: hypothetical protein V2I33_20985, partial [Kangiellaceae bacterium]|nr:hypothetical protein [Kangiellaceae bacterium]
GGSSIDELNHAKNRLEILISEVASDGIAEIDCVSLKRYDVKAKWDIFAIKEEFRRMSEKYRESESHRG